jgi:hypothetical protein
MAITQQLQTESASISIGTVALPVALGAGANRLLLVCVVVDSFTNPEAGEPTSVLYDSTPMDPVTDGVNIARSVRSSAAGPNSGTTMATFWYVLREAQLPANGAHNVAVTVLGTGGGLIVFVAGAWILEGCSQAANVRSVANASTDTPQALPNLTAVLARGEPSDAILVAGCNDINTGTIQITIGGVALTEDFDIDQSGSSRAAAGTDLTAPSAGPVGCTMTYTIAATQRAAMSAIRLQAFSIPSGGRVTFSDGKPVL